MTRSRAQQPRGTWQSRDRPAKDSSGSLNRAGIRWWCCWRGVQHSGTGTVSATLLKHECVLGPSLSQALQEHTTSCKDPRCMLHTPTRTHARTTNSTHQRGTPAHDTRNQSHSSRCLLQSATTQAPAASSAPPRIVADSLQSFFVVACASPPGRRSACIAHAKGRCCLTALHPCSKTKEPCRMNRSHATAAAAAAAARLPPVS